MLYLGQGVKEAVDARRLHHQLFPDQVQHQPALMWVGALRASSTKHICLASILTKLGKLPSSWPAAPPGVVRDGEHPVAGGGAGGARPRHQEVPHRGVHSPGLLMRIIDWLLSKPPRRCWWTASRATSRPTPTSGKAAGWMASRGLQGAGGLAMWNRQFYYRPSFICPSKVSMSRV